jgi:hypothetical protein
MKKTLPIDAFDVRTTVTQIIEGTFDPKKLTRDQRRNCVEYLRYGLRLDVTRIGKYLKVARGTVDADLRLIHVAIAKSMEHGEITSEIVGELLSKLSTNYQMALEKKDVAGANKATEALKELWQDLGKISVKSQKLEHSGTVDILELAKYAAGDEDEEE